MEKYVSKLTLLRKLSQCRDFNCPKQILMATAMCSVTALLSGVLPAAAQDFADTNAGASPSGNTATSPFGDNAVAGGVDSTANGFYSFALGNESKALGFGTVAVGNEAEASADGATAIGTISKALGSNSMALGGVSYASGDRSIAIGEYSRGEGDNATAIGADSKALGDGAIAVGLESNASYANSTAIGYGATTTESNQIVLETKGAASVLRLNEASTTLSVDNGTDSSTLNIDPTIVQLTGQTETSITGGTTEMKVNNSGVILSGPGTAPVVLSGVDDGVNDFDAVNVRQLNFQTSQTDARIGQLDNRIGQLDSQLSAGIAGTMAMTQLPTISAGDNYSFGIAVGHYNSQSAFSLGGTIQVNDMMTVRGALQHSNTGGTGAAAGAGWSW